MPRIDVDANIFAGVREPSDRCQQKRTFSTRRLEHYGGLELHASENPKRRIGNFRRSLKIAELVLATGFACHAAI